MMPIGKNWFDKKLVTGGLTLAIVIVTGVLILLYVQQQRAYDELVRESLRHSAEELASSISLDLKVRNLHGLQRIIGNSHLAETAHFIELTDHSGHRIFRFPGQDTLGAAGFCPGISGASVVAYDGVQIGALTYCIRSEIAAKASLSMNMILSVAICTIALSALLLAWFRAQTVGVSQLIGSLDRVDPEKPLLGSLPLGVANDKNLVAIYQKIEMLLSRLRRASEEVVIKEKELVFVDICRQVAHDIRSPLAALQVAVNDFGGMKEETRVLARAAVNRITDIAHGLVFNTQRKLEAAAQAASSSREETLMIASALEMMASEKRVLLRSVPRISLQCQFDEACYALFTKVKASELKRAVSNLINNSCEAIEGNGSVELYCYSKDQMIVIQVKDTGKGIPRDILPRVLEKDFSIGKKGGSGLGLYQARQFAESLGGRLQIESEVGKGTTVTMMLRKAEPPKWFSDRITLKPTTAIIVLDDDNSIHQVWQKRFRDYDPRVSTSAIKQLLSPSQLGGVLAGLRGNGEQDILALIDYEFVGEAVNGLDLIKNYQLTDVAFLVTSRFEEPKIIEECNRHRVRMIPKNMVGIVPISAA